MIREEDYVLKTQKKGLRSNGRIAHIWMIFLASAPPAKKKKEENHPELPKEGS